jgi:hypothetical protein
MDGEVFGGDLHLAKLTPEFSRFQAILGWRIKSTDQWAPFARLRDIHGWKRLTRACEQCEPGSRWASDMEKLCNQYAKDEADAERELSQREAMVTRVKPTNHEERARKFREIRERIMTKENQP